MVFTLSTHSDNKIEYSGAVELGEALKTNSTLSALYLGGDYKIDWFELITMLSSYIVFRWHKQQVTT